MDIRSKKKINNHAVPREVQEESLDGNLKERKLTHWMD